MTTRLPLLLIPCSLLTAADDQPLVILGQPVDNQELLLPLATPEGDLGQALRDLPGLDAIRMGGHGLDPVIRGQQQERLAVTIDGAQAHGGCPNRMDPPAAYIPIDLMERIGIDLGLTGLLGAAPAPGGSIRAERSALPFGETSGHGSLAATSNGAGIGLSAIGGSGNDALAAQIRTAFHDVDDYDDGHGNSVHSAATTWSAGAGIGWQDTSWTVRADLDWNAGRDLAYAGARMDAPETDLLLGQIQARYQNQDAVLSSLICSASMAAVEHVMDNFSLRPVPVMMGIPRYMRADSTSDTTTITGEAALQVLAGESRVGLSWLGIDRWAERYAGPTASVPQLQSVLWPEVSTTRLGLTVEQDCFAPGERQLTLGLRLDHLDRSAETADKPTGTGGTANDLYQLYYGTSADQADDELAVGLLLRWRQHLTDHLDWALGASRSVRPADASEAFIAAANSTPGLRWVGNPTIANEVHHQIDCSARLQQDGWSIRFALAADLVQDWILRDTAAGQDGILRSDGASIYRNVDASLLSSELSGSWDLTATWTINADLGFVYGTNESDDRPLAQMPPLDGSLALHWQASPAWRCGLIMPWAAEQHRVDTDSGVDVGETAAWAILNLQVEATINQRWLAAAGIDNCFDTHYLRHLNKASAFDPTVERVYEPGRSFWAKLSARF